MQASFFLIDTTFTFLMLAVLLRILLQWVKADFYNPICQAVLKVSNFMVLRLRLIIPAYGGMDWASVVCLLILAIIKQALLLLIETGLFVNIVGLVLLGVADSLSLLFYTYLFSLIVITVVSWLNPATINPLVQIAIQLTTPILNRIRTFLPNVGGLDLSPLVFAVGLILSNLLIIQVIAQMGVGLVAPINPQPH